MRRNEAGFIAAQAAIFVGVIALVSLPLLSANSSASDGNASNVGQNGLQLSASINATQIALGQSLQVNVSIFNTLPEVNSVPTSNDWLFQGVPVALWPPCFFAYPGSTIAVAEGVVLKGDYTMANISSAANVSFGFMCMESVDVDHAVFQPDSSLANLTGVYDVSATNGTLGPYHLSANFTTRGYWDLLNNSRLLNPPIIGDQIPPNPPIATPFVPGAYTVGIEDEWGQTVILHFVVK